jgi:hypothetical protein
VTTVRMMKIGWRKRKWWKSLALRMKRKLKASKGGKKALRPIRVTIFLTRERRIAGMTSRTMESGARVLLACLQCILQKAI